MAFSMPKNVPSFTNPQRQLEDRLWSSSGVASHRSALNPSQGGGGGVLGGVQRSVGDLLGSDRASLPMYKDKPYGHGPSARRRPWLRKKTACGIFVFVLLILIWYTSMFANHRETAKDKLDEWGLRRGKSMGRKGWEERRKRVVEAMELSWGAYERYAWGEFMDRCGWRCFGRVLTGIWLQATMSSTHYQRVGGIWRPRDSAGSLLIRWIR
jgi:mannosyl-oligosaccharide alpha-1,2-mannosidase